MKRKEDGKGGNTKRRKGRKDTMKQGPSSRMRKSEEAMVGAIFFGKYSFEGFHSHPLRFSNVPITFFSAQHSFQKKSCWRFELRLLAFILALLGGENKIDAAGWKGEGGRGGEKGWRMLDVLELVVSL